MMAILSFGVLAVLIIWVIGTYNRLIKLRNIVDEAWSNIDVQLKLRVNLIPNLVNTVQGYLKHEKTLLAEVTQLRSQSINASDVPQQEKAENALTQSLGRLFAVAESYPDLKASQQFLDLQQQLSQLEDKIQMARRYYNGTVRHFNITVQSFPGNLVARKFNFPKRDFFELDDLQDRKTPNVAF